MPTKKHLREYFNSAKIALLGFGVEGKSSYRLIRNILPNKQISIFDEGDPDKSEAKGDRKVKFYTGRKISKLDLNTFDLILKTPGIAMSRLDKKIHHKVEGQASLFLNWYGHQCIGITGTKGKSTTTSLCYHLLKSNGVNTLMGGNIGIPLFDLIPRITKNTWIVAELSCHQLEYIQDAPHIAILLNLFEDHSDYYKTIEQYFEAKLNITYNQDKEDFVIYNRDSAELRQYLKDTKAEKLSFSLQNQNADYSCKGTMLYSKLNAWKGREIESNLLGRMNRYNIMAALAAARLTGLSKSELFRAINSFTPLAHRLEYVGSIDGVKYVNDSIATIPPASIAAVKAVKEVGSWFLGGYNRGVDYSPIVDFLLKRKIRNIVFFHVTGKIMYDMILKRDPDFVSKRNVLLTNDFRKALKFCMYHTPPGTYCLMSPASPSFGKFVNFKDRGNKFKSLLLELSKKKKFDP